MRHVSFATWEFLIDDCVKHIKIGPDDDAVHRGLDLYSRPAGAGLAGCPGGYWFAIVDTLRQGRRGHAIPRSHDQPVLHASPESGDDRDYLT